MIKVFHSCAVMTATGLVQYAFSFAPDQTEGQFQEDQTHSVSVAARVVTNGVIHPWDGDIDNGVPAIRYTQFYAAYG